MQTRISALAVLFVLLMVSVCVPAYSHTDVTPSEVEVLLAGGENIVVVDVREETEFCDSTFTPPGHIPGALNLPWSSGYLQEHYGELSPEDSTVVVCRSGARSNAAANFLDSVGFTNVFDMLGGMSAWQGETGVCDASSIPSPNGNAISGLRLGAASPNPASASTTISFTIPGGYESGRVTLRIYDAGGRLLATLLDSDRGPGSYRVEWDGSDSRSRSVASGICFYQLAWNGETVTRRMILLR